MKRFIKDTYACLDNRGIHKASRVLQQYMRKMRNKYSKYYVVKCDISKFFYSVDLDILFEIMKRFIADEELLDFTKKMIYENTPFSVGIPIGNYTSQYFANIYMNELDQYVKHKLHIKYYVRYMDDFVLLVENKEEAVKVFKAIEKFLQEHLKLKLNPKSRYFPSKMGIDFCGYRIYEDYKLIRKRSIRKIKKKIVKWNNLYTDDNIDYHKVIVCWNAFLNHSSHADSYNLQNSLYKKILFLDELNLEKNKSFSEYKMRDG